MSISTNQLVFAFTVGSFIVLSVMVGVVGLPVALALAILTFGGAVVAAWPKK